MSIVNKGILNSGSAYLRQVGNDWPTAQVVTTADIIESSSNLYFSNIRVVQVVTPLLTTANVVEKSSNLYYTNARVINAVTIGTVPGDISVSGNLIANGLIIRNIAVSDSVLTGSTSANNVVADSITANTWNNLYTANVVESDTNLYYTNSRARTAYTAGTGIAISQGGVISYKQADPGLGFYNSGLTLAGAVIASNTYSNVVTFSSTDGVSFIVQSLHVTNLSPNVAYLNGRINYNYSSSSNSVVFANLLEIPGASSQELFFKPSTFKVGDQIQIQSFSNPKQPANGLISAMVSYQGSAITEYDRAATSLTSNSMSNVYTSVGKTAIVESVKVVNPNPNPATITVQIVDTTGAIFSYLASNLFIPAFSSIEVCEYPKALLTDYTIRAQKTIGFGQPLNIFTSSKYTSYFLATPSSSVINETASNTVTIDFQTLGVTNGTTFYYSIDGNVQPADFVPAANTGSFIVTNDQGTINLQIASDANFGIEGTESFRVQVRKASVTGAIVSTTSNITVQDTSTTTSYLVVENTNGIADRTSNTVIFTIQGYNVANNSVLYYSTAGNVTASQLVTANTGSFTLVDRFANLSIVAGDIPTGETRTLQLQVRTGSSEGTVQQTSNVVTIYDSAIAGIQATGGVQSNVGNYRIHTFTSSGNFSINRYAQASSIDVVELLVIAGGGGGGSHWSYGNAGGGAGGLIYRGSEVPSNATVTSAVIGSNVVPILNTNTAVVIGAGGSKAYNELAITNSGTPTTLTTSPGVAIFTAVGGGGGANWYQNPGTPQAVKTGAPGGSGGGSAGTPASGAVGLGTAGQGNPGGFPNASATGGGGGGAGAHGSPGIPTGTSAGGVGLEYSISGYPTLYAGGGGGLNGIGGAGGGGSGLNTSNGTTNTGGGGGTANVQLTPIGSGGSGIVIIRYPVI